MSTIPAPLRPLLRVAAGLLIGGVLLASLARIAPELSPSSLAERLRSGDLALLALGALVYLAVLPVRSLRWLALVRDAGSRIGLTETVGLVARSWAVNILLPLRAGDLFRVASAGSHGLARRAALGTIAAERIADLISLALVGVVAILIGGPSLGAMRGPLVLASLLVGGGAVVLLAIGLLLRRRLDLESRIGRLIAPSLSTLHLGAGRATIGRVLALSALAWVVEAGSLVIAAEAIGVRGVAPTDLAVAALVAAILATIPITPAGIGLVEGGLFGLLRFGYGLDAESAAGIIVASRAVTLIPILAAGASSTLSIGLRRLLRGARQARSG
jgi:uncharacterized membrane protein YbhN (UPF0104 family)